ncbi:MAG: hypothetical protein OXI59_01720 [Gemmatimonadota bacterium]|nr:hypothetical protein [Gemmatimonadota bacterium]
MSTDSCIPNPKIEIFLPVAGRDFGGAGAENAGEWPGRRDSGRRRCRMPCRNAVAG